MFRIFFVALFCLTRLAFADTAPVEEELSLPKKIFVVVFENRDYEKVLSYQPKDPKKQNFFKKLADEGVLFEQFSAITHPSYPNYIALTSGRTWGIKKNTQKVLDVTHLGNLLEDAGKTWKNYAQDYPGNCFLGAGKGDYVRKHVPFLSYKNVQDDKERCARVVNADELKKDIEEGTLPEFSLFTPNDKNNSHDTTLEEANTWFESEFGPWLKDERFTKDLLFVVTFDESTYIGKNRIFTTFWGPNVIGGTKVSEKHTTYSLLRLIEKTLGLSSLERNDANASVITDEIWQKKPKNEKPKSEPENPTAPNTPT